MTCGVVLATAERNATLCLRSNASHNSVARLRQAMLQAQAHFLEEGLGEWNGVLNEYPHVHILGSQMSYVETHG